MIRKYRSIIMATLIALIFQAGIASSVQASPQAPDFVRLVKENSAAVVNINTTANAKARGSQRMPFPDMPEDAPFNELFKHFFRQMPPGGTQGEERNSLGSGFIITKDGYILTNAHVVKDADKIDVGLFDHRQSAAKVIGVDERTDVALLKIDGHDLPTVKIGDSEKLQVGEWVLAIGSPFGLDYTATQGIVSAVGRSLPNDAYIPFIQTDVAVNPGNSGGPLFNTEGEVVGINSQIVSNTGGYMGLSFAVPIRVAMKVADELRTHGHVTHTWLGVLIQPVSNDLAKSFGLERAQGALVAHVEENSPAQKAGLRSGDVILRYNGQDVVTSAALPAMVGETAVGTNVPLTVWRNGKTVELKVTIAAMSDEQAMPTAGTHATNVLGIQVADISSGKRRELDLGDRGGVLVKEVDDGPAAKAGIREGDVLLRIDHKDVRSIAELIKIEERLPRDRPVSVLLQRNGSPLFVAVTIPK